MNPTLPPGLASFVPLLAADDEFGLESTFVPSDVPAIARLLCYVPCFEDNRGKLKKNLGDWVDGILREIEKKPDDKVTPNERIRRKFDSMLRIVQYYASLKHDNPELAALLRQSLEDPTFKLPGEAEIKQRRPNGNGLNAHS